MAREPRKPVEQIAAELGKYSLMAFAFVQECIGYASEKVHGPLSQPAVAVAKWMAHADIDLDELRRRDARGELPEEIAHALAEVGGPEEMNRHVSGQQLCWAVRDMAIERWGRLAPTVLAKWGIHRTEDIGAIIFALVENDWLQKQPADSIEDFDHVFDFGRAFSQNPPPSPYVPES